MVLPGSMLLLGTLHLQRGVLRGTHGIKVGYLFAELARFVLASEQGCPDVVPVRCGNGLFQFRAFLLKGAGLRGPQRLRRRQQRGAAGFALEQPVAGLLQPLHLREEFCERRNRSIEHACVIGQSQFRAPGQGVFQRLARIAAAVCADQRLVIGMYLCIAQHGGMKRLPYQGDDAGLVLDQFVLGGQAQLLQQLQRRGAQQRRKPAVEGADLHRATVLQQPQVQPLQCRGLLPCLICIQASQLQFGGEPVQRQRDKCGQPFLQPLAHFGGGLFGEGDGQDLLGRGTSQQRAHNA